MANLVLGGMTSLSQTMEIPNASNQKLLDAWHVVEPLKIANPCKVAIIKTTEQTEETHDIQDLPMSHFDFHSIRDRNLKAKHIVDCILDYRCAFNEKQILTLGEKGKFDEMPEPLCLKMPANDCCSRKKPWCVGHLEALLLRRTTKIVCLGRPNEARPNMFVELVEGEYIWNQKDIPIYL